MTGKENVKIPRLTQDEKSARGNKFKVGDD